MASLLEQLHISSCLDKGQRRMLRIGPSKGAITWTVPAPICPRGAHPDRKRVRESVWALECPRTDPFLGHWSVPKPTRVRKPVFLKLCLSNHTQTPPNRSGFRYHTQRAKNQPFWSGGCSFREDFSNFDRLSVILTWVQGPSRPPGLGNNPVVGTWTVPAPGLVLEPGLSQNHPGFLWTGSGTCPRRVQVIAQTLGATWSLHPCQKHKKSIEI